MIFGEHVRRATEKAGESLAALMTLMGSKVALGGVAQLILV